jgi:hypothetical protein
MAIGDITILEQSAEMGRGGRTYNVAAGSTIYAGEPVQVVLGSINAKAADTSSPVVGTTYYAGVASTTSTATASLAGSVQVIPVNSATTFLINPAVAATWDSQSEYDALVGKRVLIQLQAGTYSLLASDSANNGCVVMPLDVAKYPGKVAFAIRNGANILA